MRRYSVIGVVWTACLLAVLNVPPSTVRAAAQNSEGFTADDFFNDSIVRDLNVTSSSNDWATLKKNFQENTYYPCTFSWNGITMPNSTMRSRGSASRNPQKPGLRIDFNRYNSSQRFLGLKYFVLDNLWTDPSMIRERMTMLLYGRFGLPVPREAPVRLFINDEYVGLYVAVEALDDVFMARVYGSPTAYLYEYNWLSEYHFEYLGSDLSNYKAMFDPKTRSKDPDSLLWAPIERMIRAMNETPDAIFEQEMSRYVDLRAFTKLIALDNFIAESDGMLGLWGLNNFYLYRPEDSPPFQFLVWDKDSTFRGPDFPVMQGVSSNVLARRVLEIPAYLSLYLDTMDEAARIVTAANDQRPIPGMGTRSGEDRDTRRLNAAPAGWMEREIRREANQVRAAVITDRYKSGSNEDFEFGINQLIQFARLRPEFVTRETARIRQSLLR